MPAGGQKRRRFRAPGFENGDCHACIEKVAFRQGWLHALASRFRVTEVDQRCASEPTGIPTSDIPGDIGLAAADTGRHDPRTPASESALQAQEPEGFP